MKLDDIKKANDLLDKKTSYEEKLKEYTEIRERNSFVVQISEENKTTMIDSEIFDRNHILQVCIEYLENEIYSIDSQIEDI